MYCKMEVVFFLSKRRWVYCEVRQFFLLAVCSLFSVFMVVFIVVIVSVRIVFEDREGSGKCCFRGNE